MKNKEGDGKMENILPFVRVMDILFKREAFCIFFGKGTAFIFLFVCFGY